MKAISTLIIEDEPIAAEGLRTQLARVAPQVAVLGTAGTVAEGLSLIATHKPQLIFLDIELKDGTGFDLIEQIDRPEMKVIFTTAYDEYALKAFRFAAVDYLLKPVNTEELSVSVQRVLDMDLEQPDEALATWRQNTRLAPAQKKLAIHEVDGIRYVTPEEIIWIEAEGNYSRIQLEGGRNLLSSKSLKIYLELLEPTGFFRCHKSFAINLGKVSRFVRGKNPQLEMNNQSVVPVARNLRHEVLEKLENLSL